MGVIKGDTRSLDYSTYKGTQGNGKEEETTTLLMVWRLVP